MSTLTSLPKIPLSHITPPKLHAMLQTFTDEPVKVVLNKKDHSLLIVIGSNKILLPELTLNVEPATLINSLKEKGLIP